MYSYSDSGTNVGLIIALVILVVYCIVWGVASVIIAQKRGRDPVGWFFMGFFFPFFGVILLLMLHPLGGEYKKCPNCAEIIWLQANECPHCSFKYIT